MAARLRAVLPSHVVPDVEAPPNLSLLVGESEGRVRGVHWLYRGATAALRARSLERLLRGAVTHLDAYLDDPPGFWRLNARVLVRDGEAVSIDPWLGRTLDAVERRIERLGYQVVDVPGLPFDPRTLEVVLWPPRLDVDEEALPEHRGRTSPVGFDRDEIRLPLRSMVFWRGPTESVWSPSQILAAVAGLVGSGGEEFQREHIHVARRLIAEGVVRTSAAKNAPLVAALREPRS